MGTSYAWISRIIIITQIYACMHANIHIAMLKRTEYVCVWGVPTLHVLATLQYG